MIAFPYGRRYDWPLKPWAWQCVVDPAHPLGRGLSGGWPLNDGAGSTTGGTYYDVMQRFTGIAKGSVDGAMSWRGRVTSFTPASSGRIKVTGFKLLPNGSGVTMACWAYSTVWTTLDGMLIEKTTVNASYEMFTSGNHIFLRGASGASSVSSNALLSNSTWHHLVGTIDGAGNGLLYIDGALDNSGSIAAPADPAGDLYIGCYDDSGFLFNGQIDFPMVWNRVLSAREVRQLYADPYQFLLPRMSLPIYKTPSGGATFLPAWARAAANVMPSGGYAA